MIARRTDRRGQAGQGGFTLVEVLVVTVILAIILPVMASAIVAALRASGGTIDRLGVSQDAKLVGVNLVPDIQSADSVATGAAGCASGVAGAAHVASFAWDEDGVAVAVTYQQEDTSVSGVVTARRLRRYVCRDTVLQASSVTVMQYVGDLAPTVTCTPSCGAKPRTVEVVANSCARTVTGSCDANTLYAFTVSARSRDAA